MLRGQNDNSLKNLEKHRFGQKSEITKNKISSTLKKRYTEGVSCGFQKGHPTYYITPKGLISKKKGKTYTKRIMDKKIKISNKGKHFSLNTEFIKGQIPWNKGVFGIVKNSPETIEKKRLSALGNKSRLGQKKSLEEKIKQSNSMKKYRGKIHWAYGKKLTKEHIRKMLQRRPMSKLEIKFDTIAKNHGLPYKFVGNGAFFIANKNPDFINTNGEKIAVEVFYRKHKDFFRGGCKNWIEKRMATFEDAGWKPIFFNETEVNDTLILERLGGDIYR